MDGTAPTGPETGDAFGRALKAYHAGEGAHEITERDDGYLDSIDVAAYFSEYEEWSPHNRTTLDHVTGSVLDVGCGAGRIELYLQECGHEVVGIDVSQRAVEVCRERGLRDARVLAVDDVSTEALDGQFDTVLLFGNNFGLVGTQKSAPDVLDRLARVTTPDAMLVAESLSPLVTDDQAHLAYHDLNRERGRLPGAVRMRVRYGRYATPWYDYLFVAPEMMRELVEPTAWRVTEIIENNESPSYVGILRKG